MKKLVTKKIDAQLANLELEELTALTPAQLESVGGAKGPDGLGKGCKIVMVGLVATIVCGAGTGGPEVPHIPEDPPGIEDVRGPQRPGGSAPPAPSPGALRITNPT